MVRQLWNSAANFLQPFVADVDGGQIRLREIAIIVGVLLAAHRVAHAALVVPAAGFLQNLAAVLQQLNLPENLIFNGPGNGLKGIHIFSFGARAQLRIAHAAHGKVHVRPHRALLHFAIGNIQIFQGGFQLFQISQHIIGAGHIRLANDFQQGHAATVKINQRATALGLVVQLASVLLHMDFVNTHLFSALRRGNLQIPVAANGQIQLRGLERFGQIRVKVIFAVKLAFLGDGAVGGQAHGHGPLQNAFVQHRQHARHTGANRANVGVGSSAKLCGAVAENFGGGVQLHMHLQADNHLIACVFIA